MVFKNREKQVRSGWKILLNFIIGFSILLAVSTVIGMIVGVVVAGKGLNGDIQQIEMEMQKVLTSEFFIMFSIGLQNIALIVSSIIMWKAFEKKKLNKMGLTNIKESYKELLVGLALGAGTITLVTIILLLTGSVKLVNPLTDPNFSSSLLFGLISFILVGFGEEILGRGYIMSVLKQTKNRWAVIIISSIIFAALHLGNLSVAPLALINLFLVGILFGYMFMKSKNIWMPIGFHITWNYFQGYIWGFEVSGNEVSGLYQIERVKDSLINGGAFGPEGGLVVTVIIILTMIFVSRYYKDNKIDDFIVEEEKVNAVC